jgi:hypothetical protein
MALSAAATAIHEHELKKQCLSVKFITTKQLNSLCWRGQFLKSLFSSNKTELKEKREWQLRKAKPLLLLLCLSLAVALLALLPEKASDTA